MTTRNKQGETTPSNVFDLTVVSYLLPADSGPLLYEYLVHGSHGIRFFAITDDKGVPSLGICKVDGGEKLPLGGLMVFEHGECVTDRSFRFGRYRYLATVRVNWSGLTIEILKSIPNVSPPSLVLSHQIPWSDAKKPLFSN